MPQQQTNPPDSQSDTGSAPSSDFGANEWLVEEMYEQFQRDPGSVDPTWAAYFKTNGSGGNGAPHTAANAVPAPAPAPAPETDAKKAPQATPRPDSAAAEPAKGTTSSRVTPGESLPAGEPP